MTYYFSMASILASINLSIFVVDVIGCFSRMIEFFKGDVSVSKIIFSRTLGIDTFFLLFFDVLKSITIFYFSSSLRTLLEESSLTRKVLREFERCSSVIILSWSFFLGDSIFFRSKFEDCCFGEEFLKLFYAAIWVGLLSTLRSYTRRLRILCLYYSERTSSLAMISARCSGWGMKICFRS